MKVFGSALATLLIWLGASTAQPSAPDGIIWYTDFAEAKELAMRKRAPMFVVLRCEA